MTLDKLSDSIHVVGNPLLCDCELRWYHQWIEEEWNPVEQEWLKDTYCEDPADKKQHNIAEVPLKDMFCTTDVKDKPSARGVSKKSVTAMQNFTKFSCANPYYLLCNVAKTWMPAGS